MRHQEITKARQVLMMWERKLNEAEVAEVLDIDRINELQYQVDEARRHLGRIIAPNGGA